MKSDLFFLEVQLHCFGVHLHASFLRFNCIFLGVYKASCVRCKCTFLEVNSPSFLGVRSCRIWSSKCLVFEVHRPSFFRHGEHLSFRATAAPYCLFRPLLEVQKPTFFWHTGFRFFGRKDPRVWYTPHFAFKSQKHSILKCGTLHVCIMEPLKIWAKRPLVRWVVEVLLRLKVGCIQIEFFFVLPVPLHKRWGECSKQSYRDKREGSSSFRQSTVGSPSEGH